MPSTPVSNVQRQVAKASRRLFVQRLLDTLVWCWAGALLASSAWFLAQPWLIGKVDELVRWEVAGGIFAAATIGGLWLAARRAPSQVETALEFDSRFKLKERTTAVLTLGPESIPTAAGLALAADAEAYAAKVDMRQGFPVGLSWKSLAVPVCAIALAVIAVIYDPVFRLPTADAAREADKVVNAADIAEKFDKLKKSTTQPFAKDAMSEQLEEIEKLREKLLSQPFDPADKDKIRERLQKMVPLEEKIQNRLEDLKAQQDRNKAIQQKLKELGKDPEQKLAKDGPAKAIEDALNNGDIDRVQQELAALADKLKNDKLTPEDRKKLERQLDDIQQKLENIADLKDVKEQLKKDLETGKIDKEQFDKMMAKAKEASEQLQDLKALSDKIGECKASLGDSQAAAGKLAGLAKDLSDIDAAGRELDLLLEEQQQLRNLMRAMQNGLGGQPGGDPGAERPVAEDEPTGSKLEKVKATLDNKTQFRVVGEQKGGTFSKIPASQVGGAYVKAQQDAPDAIEQQQVPPDAAEMLRGYYENLGGSKKN